MNNEVMITCAVTGAGDTVGRHSGVPVTPAQVAAAAVGATLVGGSSCPSLFCSLHSACLIYSRACVFRDQLSETRFRTVE